MTKIGMIKKGNAFVFLPSRCCLRDHKNYIRAEPGFNQNIMHELQEKVKYFSDKEKFIVLLMDEMKMQENLVWDKDNGELGYVDLGNIDLNYAPLSKVVFHVLFFLNRSIVNPFISSLVYFIKDAISGFQMLPVLWKAISRSEKDLLRVAAVTSDGAFPNHKLFRMRCYLTQDDDINQKTDVAYRTRNLFSGTQNRFLYFISDVPHLLKIAQNCLSN